MKTTVCCLQLWKIDFYHLLFIQPKYRQFWAISEELWTCFYLQDYKGPQNRSKYPSLESFHLKLVKYILRNKSRSYPNKIRSQKRRLEEFKTSPTSRKVIQLHGREHVLDKEASRRTKCRGLWGRDSHHQTSQCSQCCNATLPSTAPSPDLVCWRDSLEKNNQKILWSSLDLTLMFHLSIKWWRCFCCMFNRQISSREWISSEVLNS